MFIPASVLNVELSEGYTTKSKKLSGGKKRLCIIIISNTFPSFSFLKHFFTNVYSSLLPGVLFRFCFQGTHFYRYKFYCVFNEEFSLQRLLLRLYVLKMTVLVCLL